MDVVSRQSSAPEGVSALIIAIQHPVSRANFEAVTFQLFPLEVS